MSRKSFGDWLYQDAPFCIFMPCVVFGVISGVVFLFLWVWLVIISGWLGVVVFAIPILATGFAARQAYKKANP